ncbi:MAG: S1 RNA-binding domain-containing protein [Planctomycetaceae bacterium]|nr:S1 RNA-binding domain-containing protein [Planctomycetaceae bacterium]
MFSSDTNDTNPFSDNENSTENSGDNQNDTPKQRILIGSQRNPDAYRPKPTVPVVSEDGLPLGETQNFENRPNPLEKSPLKTGQVVFSSEVEEKSPLPTGQAATKSIPANETGNDRHSDDRRSFSDEKRDGEKRGEKEEHLKGKRERRPRLDENENNEENEQNKPSARDEKIISLRSVVNIPVPSIRGNLSDDLQEEFEELFGNGDLDSLMADIDQVASQTQIETETKQKGKVLSIGKESAFIELGGREQGVIPLKQFKTEPILGQEFEVIVIRFLEEEGLYELSLPLAAADVSDWSQIENGMIVEARITGHNNGGLECEVNRLRGFIPMSQISMFRVEKPQEFVGQKLMCMVTECNPMRRNLVLSHRALLEKEREENRQKVLNELEIGQIREGLVRKLIDAGAFVDLGGVDGFIPVSALSWGRVKHPQDVISEGQRIKVKITKIDLENNRISLSYKDDAADPWANIAETFPERSTARGKVSKIMDFGAFVELMPGVEGLIHISELSHQRVGRVTEVVREGDWVDVLVLQVDQTNRRLSLSMKQLTTPPQPTPEEEPQEPEQKSVPTKIKQHHKGPLKGGIGGQSDGGKFGLKF